MYYEIIRLLESSVLCDYEKTSTQAAMGYLNT